MGFQSIMFPLLLHLVVTLTVVERNLLSMNVRAYFLHVINSRVLTNEISTFS